MEALAPGDTKISFGLQIEACLTIKSVAKLAPENEHVQKLFSNVKCLNKDFIDSLLQKGYISPPKLNKTGKRYES